MKKGSITNTINNGIARLQFSHPSSNAFPSTLLIELISNIKNLDNNPDVSIIILESGGEKAFCAGASFDELLAINTQAEGTAFFSGFANLLNAMRTCSKLIIGRVQGKAVGGGVGIIAACDYCFATENASIKLSELSIGIGPFVIAPAIERKIGVAALSTLTLTGTWHPAVWAKEKGLFTEIFPNIAAVDKAVNLFAQELVSYNISALSEMKKVLWQNTNHWDKLLIERAAISGKLALSDTTKQTLKKFKN